ncbi:AAA domain-containing protein [Spirosoma utsteinense]|uniref:DUF4011 domain-containing protein n=1 Tax=Spirosoma utsteinense TaxID=2585773 RepID=A0ABR6W168_9BACT|nr:AAA domain-containing protein [Spirosoma utsteinense]MBC3785028.1 hypothetical protein [Spirosoma utsteinense]MBC3790364.1 hypothetical protein [Spirosoma utsteinense]
MKIQQDRLVVPSTVLRAFRRRLTNLSSRNRSLVLTSLPAGQFLDLHDTDFLLNKPSFSLIADLISRKVSVPLCEVLDPRQERSNEVSRKLRRIDRTARFIEEERGTEDLYVGWPFVRGKFMDGTVVHGPLLFFPVQIQQQGKFWKLCRRGDELAFLNPTLALAYSQFSQVKLSDTVLEKTVDDFDKDPLVFRTQLYEWLKESPLEINFNRDVFADQLHFFDKQSTKSLDQLERTGELKLYPEAVLGIFPQAGSYLVPDYDTLIEESTSVAAVDTNPEADLPAPEPEIPALLPERFIHTPLPLDASQEVAVRAVKSGQSIVVQGPPGTGKSQLIANLMADAAASGKRVLLVCQKRAALDVVHERLRQVGMTPFMALVHDFQDDRRALYAQIAEQIEQLETYRQQNNSLNAVLFERDFDLESRRIDDALADLNAFKQALFDTSACGLSAKELYLTSNPNEPSIPLHDIYPHFHFSTVDSFVRRLSDYAAYQQRLDLAHPWAERVSFATFTTRDGARADNVLQNWSETVQTAQQQLSRLTDHPFSLADLALWASSSHELTALLAILDTPDSEAVWSIVQVLRTSPLHPARQLNEPDLDTLAMAWDESLTAPGPELMLQPIERPAFKALLAVARAARPSWVRWRWWQLTDPGNSQLQQVAAANGLTLSETDLQTLSVKIDKRIRLEQIQQQVEPLLVGLAIPDGLRLLNRALHLNKQIDSLSILHQLPTSAWGEHLRFMNTLSTVATVAESVQKKHNESRTYLTGKQLERIWQTNDFADILRHSLRQDIDLLIEADLLETGFSATEKVVIDRLIAIDSSRQSVSAWAVTFQNALRLAWLDHIEQQNPLLRSVSSLRMAQTELALQESVQRKQALSRAILLVKLREQTYRNLTLNRLSNVVTYRDLLHQTTKKRTIWPIRKLMESFAGEVFKLIPCWLASPESVSAMFPLQHDLFDLVIFDEASQCYAENGVPAMARGKQVVVTGDNQQLRPSDLYRARLDEPDADEETPIALEVESLLELAAQQLPQLSLTEHYRSRSLDLITFSNTHFYQNKLALLPAFDDANESANHGRAIRYLNVQGTWQQQTNPTEATAVLQVLNQVITELPGRTVGIVTFNYPQQQLIQDMLENEENPESTGVFPSADQRSALQLFVKNIENVQGDERDIIIFSTGYAPDERGRLVMQFGSLTASGGQNRLNVAVTRARERIYVVTSLWPHQLTVDEAANEGPKLLKAYLQYALDVSEGRFQPKPQTSIGLPMGRTLKNQLAAHYPNWHAELPFADLTVKEGEMYQSVVLTDDDAYYQQSIKQAHAHLPTALTARHWPFQRIWSRQFWQTQNQKRRPE